MNTTHFRALPLHARLTPTNHGGDRDRAWWVGLAVLLAELGGAPVAWRTWRRRPGSGPTSAASVSDYSPGWINKNCRTNSRRPSMSCGQRHWKPMPAAGCVRSGVSDPGGGGSETGGAGSRVPDRGTHTIQRTECPALDLECVSTTRPQPFGLVARAAARVVATLRRGRRITGCIDLGIGCRSHHTALSTALRFSIDSAIRKPVSPAWLSCWSTNHDCRSVSLP